MEKVTRKSKRKILFAALRVMLALGIAFFICQINLDYLESFFYDLRVRMRAQPETSGQISLILIDTKTQESLKRLPEALDYVQLFDQLKQSGPKKVVYVDNFGDIVGSYEELETLANSAIHVPFLVIDDTKLPDLGVDEDFRLLPPMQELKVESGPKTADKESFAKDGVTRRLIVSFEGQPLAHLKIASEVNGLQSESQYRGVFNLKRTNQAYIQFRKTGTYPSYSFIDVISGKVDPELLKDRILFIGRDTRAETTDYVMTPYSRDLLAMSRAELHANILDTLILNNAPVQLPKTVNLVVTCLIAILTVFVVLTLRPARGLFIIAISMATFAVLAWSLFAGFSIWMNVAHPFLAIFICYYFFIPYRLIIENRRSWEYYQRNALLTQVEELKSNFLKMMSHDLKTPLARIQGMTEIAMRENETLSERQVEALKTISQSSDELSEFISSVLDLGRIESKEIKLQLRSKDVNALLTEIIQKLQYLAKQKNIEIVTEFEPMFSVKMDEDLIRQVFTNLVENAIKYSPEGSKILVTTEEIEGKIQVQVADQGIGIPKEDLDNLFSKFYRAKGVRDTIKGSGLGLYLARYFVNLHQGSITVESEAQRGSTFTVELPMNL